jgi:predicted lipoprotein with Yx(FWY)xxD motif
MFTGDKRNKSSCSGSCATNWPPLTTSGKPVAGAGAKASLLGRTMRSDGRMQVTYNRHPLYRFAQDSRAGQTNGEGINAFGGHWYAVSPAGTKVMSPGGGGYGGGGYGGYGGGAIGG